MGIVWDLQEINFSQWSRPETYNPPHQARKCAPTLVKTLSWQRAVKNPSLVKGVFHRGSGVPDTSWCSQNKTSQSNHELKVSTGGEEVENGGGGAEMELCVCRQTEWVGGRALHHQSCELRGLSLALRGVCASKSQNHPVCCSQSERKP